MTHKNKTSRPFASLLVTVSLLTTGIGTVIASSGCQAGTKTIVSPATTDATHGTRIERPGRTKVREFELEIRPPSEPTAQPSSQINHGMDLVGPAGMMAAPDRCLSGAAYQPFEQVAMRSVAFVKPVSGDERQDIDPSIARAIAEAVSGGSSVSIKVKDTEEIPMAADVSESTLRDSGAGLNTHSDEAAIGFDGFKTGAGLPYGGKSGKTQWGLDASLFSRGVNPMHIIGTIVMLGAIVPLWAPPRRWKAAGVIVGVGLLIIAAGTVSEQAPWVFILAIIGFIGLAGWLGYESWRSNRRKVALDSVVEGVQISQAMNVKAKIEEAAGHQLSAVKAEVNSVKNKLRKHRKID